MWKPLLAASTALVIAGTSLGFAQDRAAGEGVRGWRPNVEDLRAFGDARLAAIKAGLALKPDQEKAWPAFEQAARELTRVRIDRLANAAGPGRQADPAERMQRRAAVLSESGAALKKLGDATAPLYATLDQNQKHRFVILTRRLVSGGRHHFRGREHGMREHGMREHGMRDHGMQRRGDTGFGPQLSSPVRGEEQL
jgi:zinc resistance-associated protein